MMSEQKIEDCLYRWLAGKRHYLITPNVTIFGDYESDLVSVTRAGFVNEYEIKISAKDFKREFIDKEFKHICLKEPSEFEKRIPNYFYFVFPAELFRKIKKKFELPPYAGVVTIDNGKVAVPEQAPKLHRISISKRKLEYLGRGLMFRYWGERLG